MPGRLKRAAIRLVAVAAVATTPMLATVPAYAAKATHGWDSYLNLYEDHGYKGHVVHRLTHDKTFYNDRYGFPSHSFNDAASSVSNRSPYWWYLYRDTNYHGPKACVAPNSQESDLRNEGIGDWVSSVRRSGQIGGNAPSGCWTVVGII